MTAALPAQGAENSGERAAEGHAPAAVPAGLSGLPGAFPGRPGAGMDAERDAAAAMVEAAARAMQAAFSELSPRPSPIPPRAAVAQILQPALRALAAHQLRTPSDLPAQSVVAWLRTVASAMGDGVPPADAAQDGAGTALGGVEAVGKGAAPDGAAAGAGEALSGSGLLVLVHGTSDAAHVAAVLDDIHARRTIGLVLTPGGHVVRAPLISWADQNGVTLGGFMDTWSGPYRPQLVVAFPDAPDAGDVIRQAQKAGVPVLLVPAMGADAARTAMRSEMTPAEWSAKRARLLNAR